jgi:hypothetical protein
LGRVFELVHLIREADEPIEGATIVEIGTGWRPFVPFVLALGGAKRIVTIDVNPWLSKAYAWETWRSLRDSLPEIAAHCRLPENLVQDRYLSVPEEIETLEELLAPLGIEYVYPGDARSTGLPEGSVDVVLSSNVLEHIPREVQADIHRETRRILKPRGIAAHRFNPQDHFATVDPAITNVNFLRYSSARWRWYGGSGLAYHNRLRAPDYRRMFNDAGLNVEICRERIDERSLRVLQAGVLRVHKEFRNYTMEELAVDYMWTVCRKPAGPTAERVASGRIRGCAPSPAAAHSLVRHMTPSD